MNYLRILNKIQDLKREKQDFEYSNICDSQYWCNEDFKDFEKEIEIRNARIDILMEVLQSD